jgi:glutamate-1-semialdehyde 2,1-aminomutase
MATVAGQTYVQDAAARTRAAVVIPGGMYGHQNAIRLPEGFPQFLAEGRGCRIWDVDGNEYIDFMCSYGPIVLGHRHVKVDAAAAAQQARADCQNGPSTRLVELAELLVSITPHADWAMFGKNGTDVTTWCVTIARGATGKQKILTAQGAYHGSAPWCTPRLAGTTPEDRAHILHYTYNDLASVERAASEAGEDLAGIVVSAYRHDAPLDQELVDPVFARGLRDLCTRKNAVLILDDVRAGFRLSLGGSWEPLGVQPDLSAYSKAIANGYPLAAIVGGDAMRTAASEVFATGSFWFSAVPMAAAIATLETLRDENGIAAMEHMGRRLREGLARQAESHGLSVNQTGPVQMPFLTFAQDNGFEQANLFTGEAAKRGVYLHPRHNWFLSAAHTEHDISQALERTDAAFAAVRRRFGADRSAASVR